MFKQLLQKVVFNIFRKKFRKNSLVFILFSCVVANYSMAHSGGTDSSGGHYNRKTGGYHNHNSGYSSPSVPANPKPKRKEAQPLAGYKYLSDKGIKACRNSSLVTQTQESLNVLGYSAGEADGKCGKNTRNAIRTFQKMCNQTHGCGLFSYPRRGTVTGEPSGSLLIMIQEWVRTRIE